MTARSSRRLRIGLVADLREERWPSMDLVAEMLHRHLCEPAFADSLDVTMLCPPLARLAPESPWRRTRTIERFVNRFWDYPRWLRGRASAFDVLHVVDHSYAHVVHQLPAPRTVVTCHDADAFLPLLHPEQTASALPQFLTRRVLSGLQKAAAVTCVSQATLDDLRRDDLIAADRLSVVHNGVHPAYSSTRDEDAERRLAAILGSADDGVVELLHVGTCIPRKRIDVLLRVLAAVRQHNPRARLLKAGGSFTADQRALIEGLGLGSHIVSLPFLGVDELAALYRRAAVVLVPSEREGFGLPIVEALACGTTVLVSDLPVTREVGGDAVRYLPIADIGQWTAAVLAAVGAHGDTAARQRQHEIAVRQAARFSWETAAKSFAQLYERVASSCPDTVRQPDAPIALASTPRR